MSWLAALDAQPQCLRGFSIRCLDSSHESLLHVCRVRSLRHRFELSEKDEALLHDVREAVSNQGAQSQAQYTHMLSMFKQMEGRLNMKVRATKATPLFPHYKRALQCSMPPVRQRRAFVRSLIVWWEMGSPAVHAGQ